MGDWHDAHLAGRWYPADAGVLRDAVRTYLATAHGRAEATPSPRSSLWPRGIIVPHAGYTYSGGVAAYGYAAVQGGPYHRVVVLAPSHFTALNGAALLPRTGFTTPLGRVAIDTAAGDQLRGDPLFCDNAEAFAGEHAIEIQLPFLQTVLPQAVVVPVLLGQLDAARGAAVAATLRRLDDAATLFVVSSDFTHYGARFDYLPFPPRDATSVRAGLRRLDLGAIDRVCCGDVVGFRRLVAETGATICGRVPIAVFLDLHAQQRGELLCYQTSLDVTGDYEHCVSYASIAFPTAAH